MEQELFDSDTGFQMMCEMFILPDELLNRHSVYEVYTNNTKEKCFEILSKFYGEILYNKYKYSDDDDEMEEEEKQQIDPPK